jgi:hypothetical protein
MRIYYSLIFIIIAFTALTCGSGNVHFDPYSDVLEKVPISLRVFFPDSVVCSWARVTFNEIPFDNTHQSKTTFYYIEAKSIQFESIVESMKSKAIASYRFSDTCNVVVNKFQRSPGFVSSIGRESVYERWIKSIDLCNENRFPIPNFAGLDSPNFVDGVGLSDDFEILVQESNTEHNSIKNYQGKIKVIMPSNWEHGFSRGVCVNYKNQSLIWWLVIW